MNVVYIYIYLLYLQKYIYILYMHIKICSQKGRQCGNASSSLLTIRQKLYGNSCTCTQKV